MGPPEPHGRDNESSYDQEEDEEQSSYEELPPHLIELRRDGEIKNEEEKKEKLPKAYKLPVDKKIEVNGLNVGEGLIVAN